jgi:HD superfamily phosphodiesterase
MKNRNLQQFYISSENGIRKALFDCFSHQNWVEVFLDDTHHGYEHGYQVRINAIKIVYALSESERSQFEQEGKSISTDSPNESAMIVTEICAVMHDCGRFDDDGQLVAEKQHLHHIIGAKRAERLFSTYGIHSAIPYSSDAIISHDYQSAELTPQLTPPKTMIGKIVQSADQLGWFHPGSVQRTMDYGKAFGRKFYDPKLSLEDRMAWKSPAHSPDAVTVLLAQYFGHTGEERFAIAAARKKAEESLHELRINIIKLAEEQGCKEELRGLIAEYERRI